MITEYEKEAVAAIESDAQEIERTAVINEALSWLGTPFAFGARVKGVGIDCGQYLVAVYSAVGMMPDFTPKHYSSQWHLHNPHGPELYMEDILKFAHPVDHPKRGDVAMFHIGRHYGHGAIIIEWPNRVIHAPGPDRHTHVQLGDAARDPLFLWGGRAHPPKFFSPWK